MSSKKKQPHDSPPETPPEGEALNDHAVAEEMASAETEAPSPEPSP